MMLTDHGRQLVDAGSRLLADLEEVEARLHREPAGHRPPAGGRVLHRDARPGRAGRARPPRRPPRPRPDPRRTRALGHRRPGRVRPARPRHRAPLGRRAARVPEHVVAHRRPRRRRRDRAARPPAGRALPVTPRDLLDEAWIATPEGTICRQWLTRMYDGTGRRPGSRTCRWSSTPTSRWSAPGSASRWSPGSAGSRSATSWSPCAARTGADPRRRRAAPAERRLPRGRRRGAVAGELPRPGCSGGGGVVGLGVLERPSPPHGSVSRVDPPLCLGLRPRSVTVVGATSRGLTGLVGGGGVVETGLSWVSSWRGGRSSGTVLQRRRGPAAQPGPALRGAIGAPRGGRGRRRGVGRRCSISCCAARRGRAAGTALSAAHRAIGSASWTAAPAGCDDGTRSTGLRRSLGRMKKREVMGVEATEGGGLGLGSGGYVGTSMSTSSSRLLLAH